ncbi:unnamed protein product [Eretmochelys imbricata]
MEGTGVTSAAAMPTASPDSRGAPPAGGKGQSKKKGKGPAKTTRPSVAGTTPTATARIYLSRFHLSQAHSSSIRLAPFSDHHLATVTASLCVERLGLAYWHFNNSLLEDEGFVTSFREFWLAWRGQRRAFPSARRWWDLGKVCAWLFYCDYIWGTSRRRNAAIEQLEQEVFELERRLAANPEDPLLCGACQEKWEELRALEDHRARGAFV